MRQHGNGLVDRPQTEHPCSLAKQHLTQSIVRIRSPLGLPYVGRVGGRFRVHGARHSRQPEAGEYERSKHEYVQAGTYLELSDGKLYVLFAECYLATEDSAR